MRRNGCLHMRSGLPLLHCCNTVTPHSSDQIPFECCSVGFNLTALIMYNIQPQVRRTEPQQMGGLVGERR